MVLANGCAVGTLYLEEFPGKVKGVWSAHSMLCSEYKPRVSILLSLAYVSNQWGRSSALRFSCVVCCGAWIWQQRANVSPQQEICQELAQREASLAVGCLLGHTCWNANFHFLPCNLVGPELSQEFPLSPMSPCRWLHRVLHGEAPKDDAKVFPSLPNSFMSSVCGCGLFP